MGRSPVAGGGFADTTVKPVGRKPPRVAVVAPVYTTIVASGSVVRGPAGRFTTGGSVGARVGTTTGAVGVTGAGVAAGASVGAADVGAEAATVATGDVSAATVGFGVVPAGNMPDCDATTPAP